MANRSKGQDLRDMDTDELETRLSEVKQELFNLRFKHVTGQLDNISRLGLLRKDVARMHTILREHEIAAAQAAHASEGTTRG